MSGKQVALGVLVSGLVIAFVNGVSKVPQASVAGIQTSRPMATNSSTLPTPRVTASSIPSPTFESTPSSIPTAKPTSRVQRTTTPTTKPTATAMHFTQTTPTSTAAGNTSSTGSKHCPDFKTHAEAQAYFVAHGGSPSNNVDGLDRDKDGVACENLP